MFSILCRSGRICSANYVDQAGYVLHIMQIRQGMFNILCRDILSSAYYVHKAGYVQHTYYPCRQGRIRSVYYVDEAGYFQHITQIRQGMFSILSRSGRVCSAYYVDQAGYVLHIMQIRQGVFSILCRSGRVCSAYYVDQAGYVQYIMQKRQDMFSILGSSERESSTHSGVQPGDSSEDYLQGIVQKIILSGRGQFRRLFSQAGDNLADYEGKLRHGQLPMYDQKFTKGIA